MTDFDERLLITDSREIRIAHLPTWAMALIPLAAILFEVYVPLAFRFFGYLELPLLVTVYFAINRRSPVAGTLIGAGIGLMQDSFSHQPLGMFGISKTLVGYFAASIGSRFDVDHFAVRFVVGFFFFFFHQFLYWVLVRALLGQPMGFDVRQTLLVGCLNAAVAIPLFHIFDKLKEAS
jgi:rod shape-determining protein MreD